MNLLDRIVAWLKRTPPFVYIVEWMDESRGQYNEARTSNDCERLRELARYGIYGVSPAAVKRAREIGCEWAVAETEVEKFVADLRENATDKVREVLESGTTGTAVDAGLEAVGKAIYWVFREAALPDPGASDESSLADVEKFMGAVTALSGAPQVLSFFAETASAGQLDTLGNITRQMYFNLGLGFITWQMTSPMLEGGIGANLQRYANRLYRPKRFSESQVLELLALGQLNPQSARQYLAEEGWRGEDIQSVIDLAYKPLSQGTLFAAWEEGIITETRVASELRKQGYQPADIATILKLERPGKEANESKVLLSTLTSAFRDSLISEAEFRSLMLESGYSDDEIRLRIANVIVDRQEAVKRNSKSDVENAYKNNIIGVPEVHHYLGESGYDTEAISLLVQTWNAEKKPDVLKLNRTTILDAWEANLIDRAHAVSLLVDLGYSQRDANLIVDADLTLRKRQAEIEPLSLSQGLIQRAWRAGVIDETEVRDSLIELGYTAGDAETLFRTFQIEAQREGETTRRQPSQGVIIQAFLLNLLDRGGTRTRLTSIGFSQEDANFLIDTAIAGRREEEADIVRKLSRFDIVNAYDVGLFTREESKDALTGLGYTVENAEILLTSFERQRSEREEEDARELREAHILDAYALDLISRPRAHDLLEGIGFTEQDATFILNNEDEALARREEETARRLSDGFILRTYEQGILTRNQARERLIENGLSEVDAELALSSVDQRIEASLTPEPRRLDRGVVVQSFLVGLITRERARGHLIEIGYTEDDAELILDTARAGQEVPERPATLGAWLEALQNGIVGDELFTRGLEKLGFDAEAINLYRQLVTTSPAEGTQQLSRTQIEGLYRAGRITRAQAMQRIMAHGYSASQADEILFLNEPRLSERDYLSLFKASGGDMSVLIAQMEARGYSQQQARAIIRGSEPRMSAEGLLEYYQLGGLSRGEVIARLQQLEYDVDGVEFLILLSEEARD